MDEDDYTIVRCSLRRDSDIRLLHLRKLQSRRHTFTGGVDLRMGSVVASDVYYTSTVRVVNNWLNDLL
jgi:hypothetical protein